MRVLVVDDDDLVRTVAVETLEDAGFEVIEAATAEEALDRCEKRTADVLFTDIMLSGNLDGWDIAERCREAHPDIPLSTRRATRYGRIAPCPAADSFTSRIKAQSLCALFPPW